MSLERRDGQLLDDDEIEEYWQFCERKPQHPVIKYDILMGWALLGLGCGAFWALVWMFAHSMKHALVDAVMAIIAGLCFGQLIKWVKRRLR
jgi:hypothetical protein